jgi:hypothetical protein
MTERKRKEKNEKKKKGLMKEHYFTYNSAPSSRQKLTKHDCLVDINVYK